MSNHVPLWYATINDFVQSFGINETSQLLCDEEDLITSSNFKYFLNKDLADLSEEELQALNKGKARLEESINQVSLLMNSYIANVLSLPISNTILKNTPLKTCCLELSRCHLMDDDDNSSEISSTRCKRWLSWLKDISTGKVQLSTNNSSESINNKVRQGQSKSKINWDTYP